jgi:hypothetical protein
MKHKLASMDSRVWTPELQHKNDNSKCAGPEREREGGQYKTASLGRVLKAML